MGLRDDDIMIMHDADELPSSQALVFLKVHDGYPEPFGFIMKHRVFGFFWRTEKDISNIYGGATIGFVHFMLHNETYYLRNPSKITDNNSDLVGKYKRVHHGRIYAWSFGNKDLPAGYHCSWCFDPSGIQYKLISAHVSDSPRWGGTPKNTELPFIQTLITEGQWFDNKTTFYRTSQTGEYFAPSYLLKHYNRFEHLVSIKSAIKHASRSPLIQKTKTKIID